jgi:hypothetical protein
LGERCIAIVARIVFVLIEVTLLGGALSMLPVSIYVFITVLVLPMPLDVIAALTAVAVAWLLLRKLNALARNAVFRAIERRARRRVDAPFEPRAAVALDATSASASGSPVAVSVDVDHDEPARRA